MTALSLGPLALPLVPLLLLASAWAAGILADRLARRAGVPETAGRPGDLLLLALGVGLLGARAGWLLLHPQPYLADPLSALDPRDGGWWPSAGLVCGLAWLAWRTRRHGRDGRRAVAAGALAGLTLWLAGAWASGNPPDWWARGGSDRPLPADLRFEPLEGGAARSLAQAADGRPLVVSLWASWCGPCRVELPLLAAARRAHPEVAFVFVNQGERAEVAQAYLQAQGLDLGTVWLDPGSRLGPAMGSRGLPTTLFVDAQGRVRHVHLGVINEAGLAARLLTLRR